jgi:hypothetical protein
MPFSNSQRENGKSKKSKRGAKQKLMELLSVLLLRLEHSKLSISTTGDNYLTSRCSDVFVVLRRAYIITTLSMLIYFYISLRTLFHG